MPNTFIDLTGQKFGQWVVLSRANNSLEGRAQWLCECECGTQRVVLGKSLRSGSSTSCGCSRHPKKLNLIGQRFGRLEIIEAAPNKANKRTAWLCQCDCGNQKIIGTKELQNGDTKSCGCLKDDVQTIDILNQRFGRLTVIERVKDNQPYLGAFWKCKCDCGNIITTSGARLRSGHVTSCGCLVSKGEALIQKILSQCNIEFKQQYSFKECLTENNNCCKFDFAIFDNEKLICLIEYDGIQHFQETKITDLENIKYRDEIKNEYCKQHNLPLIRIPYTDYDKINDKYLLERIEKCQNIVDMQ